MFVYGVGVGDVVYFIGISVFCVFRFDYEDVLLEVYFEEFSCYDIGGYMREDLF